MALMMTCNLCKKEKPDELPFQVPNDPVGIAIMQQHLFEEHKVHAEVLYNG